MASGGPSEEMRIPCRSRRSVLRLIDAVFAELEGVIGKSSYLAEDDKNRCLQRFREIYEDAFHHNILIDGQQWSEASSNSDVTTEFEALNVEKKKYISETLVRCIDNSIVNTTQKRKLCPALCQKNYKKYYNLKFQNLSSAEVHCKRQLDDKRWTQYTLDTTDMLKDRATKTARQIAHLTKGVSKALGMEDQLHETFEIAEKVKKSRTHRIIFDYDSDDDKMAASLTPLKQQLKKLAADSPPKKS